MKMRRCIICLAALAATVGLAHAALSGQQGVGASAPLLAWSNRALLDASSPSIYESARVDSSTANLVLGAIGKAVAGSAASLIAQQAGGQHADLAVVFLGSQVDASVLRQAKALQPMQQLSGLLGAAQSSLVLPFVKHQGASLLQELREQFQATGVSLQVVGCDAGSSRAELAHEVKQAIQQQQEPQVLLVCASTTSQQGSTLALQAEVDQVQAVQAAAQEALGADKHLVFVYANQPLSGGASRRSALARRRAQESDISYSGFGPYTVCGPMCITQVAWLQGIIATLFLGFATCSGLACLYLLNGPTKFETSKDNPGGGN